MTQAPRQVLLAIPLAVVGAFAIVVGWSARVRGDLTGRISQA